MSGSELSGEPQPTIVADLERSLFLLGQALRKIKASDSSTSAYATGAGYWELVVLWHRGAVRTSAIASAISLDISTVSRQLKILEGEGLVARETDPTDARAQLVALTDKGKLVVRELAEMRKTLLASAISHWSHEDTDLLNEMLKRFVGDIEGSIADPSRSDVL